MITEEDIISAAKFKLNKVNSTDSDDYFSFLVQEGARHLGALSQFIKVQCTIDIIDGKSELPKGFYRLLGLRFDNTVEVVPPQEGGPIIPAPPVVCQPMFYVDSAFLNDCGCNLTGLNNIQNFWGVFQINKGFIHYNSGIGINSRSATLAYLSFNVDKQGRMILQDDYERALTAYCCYNFIRANIREYDKYMLESFHEEWKAQKSWIKGKDAVTDAKNMRREIASIMSGLLVSPTLTWTSQ